jgi:hypothetical protein
VLIVEFFGKIVSCINKIVLRVKITTIIVSKVIYYSVELAIKIFAKAKYFIIKPCKAKVFIKEG